MKKKLKTRKSAAKRIRITGTGKVKRYRAGKRHLLEHKAPAGKRQKRSGMIVHPTDMNNMRRMIPGLRRGK